MSLLPHDETFNLFERKTSAPTKPCETNNKVKNDFKNN